MNREGFCLSRLRIVATSREKNSQKSYKNSGSPTSVVVSAQSATAQNKHTNDINIRYDLTWTGDRSKSPRSIVMFIQFLSMTIHGSLIFLRKHSDTSLSSLQGSISLRNIGNDYEFNTVLYPKDTAMNTNRNEILKSHMKFLLLAKY